MPYSKDTKKVIEIRPIEVKRWHEKKGAESFARTKKIQALVDGASMRYATGLDEDDIETLSKVVNYDLSPHFNPEQPHPFWDSNIAIVKLENNTQFLHLNQPLDYIKYKVMLASRFVANSVAEVEEGRWPDATHVISDDKETADIQAKKIQKEEDAIILAQSLTLDRKVELVLILAGKNLRGQSESFVKIEINKLIKADPDTFLAQANKKAEENADLALVLEAIQKNIFRKEAGRVMYFEESLGMTEEDAARYLSDDKNQDFKLLIKQKLEN